MHVTTSWRRSVALRPGPEHPVTWRPPSFPRAVSGRLAGHRHPAARL